MNNVLKDLLNKKRIILCCGSGGAGKTTISAAIALYGAIHGKRTIVLTIDPAKRLANSLGLDFLGNKEQKIDLSKLDCVADGELWAMMLDTKRTFDDLISKYAPNKESEERILNNNIYKHLSSTLAGSQEYMAMEKLYELYQEQKFDLIVVDTPPTRHALDFLDAPNNLSNFLDESVFKWFLMPISKLGSWSVKIFTRGSALIMKFIEKLTGLEPLKDLSEFFQNFQDMYAGFKSRADEVSRFLTGTETSFLLVAVPTRVALEEAKFFYRRLRDGKMPFGAFIINRVNPTFHSPGVDRETLQLLIEGKTTINGESELTQKFARVLSDYRRLGEQDRYLVTQLLEQFRSKPYCTTIPHFAEDVHDITGLNKINEHLFIK